MTTIAESHRKLHKPQGSGSRKLRAYTGSQAEMDWFDKVKGDYGRVVGRPISSSILVKRGLVLLERRINALRDQDEVRAEIFDLARSLETNR